MAETRLISGSGLINSLSKSVDLLPRFLLAPDHIVVQLTLKKTLRDAPAYRCHSCRDEVINSDAGLLMKW